MMAAKRVLIVDDALELGRLLQAALATLDAGLQVTVVPSAEEALLEAARRPVDVVVTDIRLPGISGLELTRRLRTRHKGTRIIQITGLSDATMRQQSIDAGADFFFKKPLSMPEFLSAVQQVLGMVKTETQPPPMVEPLPRPQTDRIAEALAATRRAIGAYAVALLDDHGHILVQDGELSERDLDPGLLPALLNTLNAGEKVSRYLGIKAPESTFTFKGRAFELVVSPLGGAFAILLMMKTGRSSVRLAIAVDEVLNARKEMEHILVDMGVALHPQPTARITGPLNPEKAPKRGTGSLTQEKARAAAAAAAAASSTPASPETAPSSFPVQASSHLEQPSTPENIGELKPEADLENLLGSPDKTKLKSEEVNAFWEAAEKGEAASRLVLPNKISYEQARQMGLAPDAGKTSS
jgi:CheY-like chemotaxis protein